MPLIIRADMIDPSWNKWAIDKCPCARKHCNYWRLNTTHCEGNMAYKHARLANAAPKLVMALVRIVGGVDNPDPQAVEALQAALGKDNVFVYEEVEND